MVPQVKMMRISTARCTPRKGIRSKWEEKRREKRTEAKGEGREKGKKEKIHWKRTEKKEEKRNGNRTDKRGHRQNVGLRPRNLEKWPPACQCVLMETWKLEKYSLVHWQHVQPMAHCRCIGMHNWGIRKMGMDQYLLIPFLGGWTSICQLFWCSPGVQGFDTLPNHSMCNYCEWCTDLRQLGHLLSTYHWNPLGLLMPEIKTAIDDSVLASPQEFIGQSPLLVSLQGIPWFHWFPLKPYECVAWFPIKICKFKSLGFCKWFLIFRK